MAPVPDSTLPGYVFLRERVDSFLDLLSEGRNLDFKESQPYDVLKYKIIKAALAMSNVRNGKAKMSRRIGIPLTRSGRHQKIGRGVTGGGCLLPLVGMVLGVPWLRAKRH